MCIRGNMKRAQLECRNGRLQLIAQRDSMMYFGGATADRSISTYSHIDGDVSRVSDGTVPSSRRVVRAQGLSEWMSANGAA